MSEALATTEDEAPTGEPTKTKVVPKSAFTSETARAAGRASQARRAQREQEAQEPPSDDAIERGLRQRAVGSAKDAEVLLRWLQRPRQDPSGMGLDEHSTEALEALHAGLLRLAGLEASALAALLVSQQ